MTFRESEDGLTPLVAWRRAELARPAHGSARPGVTALSRSSGVQVRLPRRFAALARLSLFTGVMAPALTGCLDPTPQYTVPDPVPPVLEVDKIDPSPTALVHINTDVVFPFTVPFRADDAGEGLLAYFFYDIPAGTLSFTSNFAGSVARDPDDHPFAQQDRPPVVFHWAWATAVSPGCHTLTMILSHTGNLETSTGDIIVKDPLAAAEVTWFLALSKTGTPQDCGGWPDPSTGLAP